MSISKRLKYIADLVTCTGTAADIGTDHALVPLYLLKEGRCSKVIAADISSACLKKAQEAAVKYGLEGRLEPRLSDGFEKIVPYEADTVIITGMGGIAICSILEKGAETAKTVKELILSPHRDADLVREFLAGIGFEIVADEKITDKKKEYCVIKARNSRFFLKEEA